MHFHVRFCVCELRVKLASAEPACRPRAARQNGPPAEPRYRCRFYVSYGLLLVGCGVGYIIGAPLAGTAVHPGTNS